MRRSVLYLGLVLCALSLGTLANNRFHKKHKGGRNHRQRRHKSVKPNIVVILTDDQDTLLGSLKVMPKLNRLVRNQGAYFNNSFATTPMCCPSRSSILTGLYVHNHNTYTNNDNCSSIMWQKTHETRSFATYLRAEGYKTGYFGKYLNEYNGTYIPPGWSEWVGLIRNSRYYNYSINFNGQKIKHGDNYYKDYLTDLIANDSVTFLKQSKQYFSTSPVLMVLSVPAPHGPEDAAPQYQHMFKNNKYHRTPSWNHAPNPDKQWLLQYTEQMAPLHIKFTDMLHRKRLQTLQSVDDLVEKVYTELKTLGELDNTYIIYMSDHGYHLGQYGLVKGKATPYDFDVRIPMLIRGPGIQPRSVVNNIVANIDVAPTILDMAGVEIPDDMDGRSMLRLLRPSVNQDSENSETFLPMRKAMRDTILIERGKLTRKQLQLIQRSEKKDFLAAGVAQGNRQYHYYMTGHLRKLRECSKPEFQLPCKPKQKWYCEEKSNGIPRRHKCRGENLVQSDQPIGCNCAIGADKRKMKKAERKNQRRFLKNYVQKDFRPKFLRAKRAIDYAVMNAPTMDMSSAAMGRMFDRRCRTLPNDTIVCDRELYENPGAWQNHKERVEEMIKEYRKALEDLRDIRRHLKEKRPDEMDLNFPVNWDTELLSESINLGAEEEEDCDCEDIIPSSKSQMRSEQKELRWRRRMMKRRRQQKRKRKNPDCNSPNMKCFTHDNNHWQTPPKWNYMGHRKSFLKHMWCKKERMECSVMTNGHWRTAPFWTLGPFCFCPNANNNTYWCLRTINETHNFLYCEFITKFISYFNFREDPHQLNNTVRDLNFGVLQQLHDTLKHMKWCTGSSCDNGVQGTSRYKQDLTMRRRVNQSRRDNDYKTILTTRLLPYKRGSYTGF